jgi:hypothetical protein
MGAMVAKATVANKVTMVTIVTKEKNMAAKVNGAGVAQSVY